MRFSEKSIKKRLRLKEKHKKRKKHQLTKHANTFMFKHALRTVLQMQMVVLRVASLILPSRLPEESQEQALWNFQQIGLEQIGNQERFMHQVVSHTTSGPTLIIRKLKRKTLKKFSNNLKRLISLKKKGKKKRSKRLKKSKNKQSSNQNKKNRLKTMKHLLKVSQNHSSWNQNPMTR